MQVDSKLGGLNSNVLFFSPKIKDNVASRPVTLALGMLECVADSIGILVEKNVVKAESDMFCTRCLSSNMTGTEYP